MNGFITFCGVLLTFLIVADGQSHFCPQSYTVQKTRQVATTVGCGQWNQQRCTRYRREYYPEILIDETVCCTNFTGENCDIPECTPPCKNNAPCIIQDDEQHTCYCPEGSTGDTCELEYCSLSNNCFPGTCISETLECVCASGYGGPNCTDVLTAADLTACEMRFTKYDEGTDIILATYDCTDASQEIVYIGATDADDMYLDYKLSFNGPETPVASYIKVFKIGLIASSFDRKISPPMGESAEGNTVCKVKDELGEGQPSQDTPYLNIECIDIQNALVKDKLRHGGNLSVVIYGESGGYKEYVNEVSQVFTTYYNGIVSSFERSITFDTENPFHCSKTDQDCGLPVSANRDITTIPDVHVQWFGWTDDDSGIATYNYSIYKMSKGANDKLQEIDLDNPMLTKMTGPEGYFFNFTFNDAGMYSIRLEVTDYAGNSYKARCLVLFENSRSISVDENNKIIVDNSIVMGDNIWFRDSSEDLVIHWEGRYSNQVLNSNNWLNAVEDESDQLLDDQYGNRTIDEIINKRGIVSFIVTHDTGSFDDLPESPDNLLTRAENLQETYTLTGDDREDGKAVRFFITATDAVGNKKTEMQTVLFDSSKAVFEEQDSKVDFNPDSDDPALPFATRVELAVVDADSGIHTIQYEIFDVAENTRTEPIFSGSQDGQTCEGNIACDCPYSEDGPCYMYLQTIWLDNCQLIEQEGRTLELKMTVTNGAGLEDEFFYDMGTFENLKGVALYPPPTKVTHKGDVPKVTISWQISQSCYELTSIQLMVSENGLIRERSPDKNEREYDIDTLAGSDYIITVTAVYAGGTSNKSEAISFTTSGTRQTQAPPNTPVDPDPIITIGIWAAIGVGGLIFLALTILIIVMIVRKTQQKPVVPPVLREKAVRLRDGVSSRISRISQYFGRQSQAEDEDEEKGGGAERRDKSRRRRSLGFRWSRYNVHDDEVRLDSKKKDDNRRREKDRERDRSERNGRGEMTKCVSFEREEPEDTKPPKSILKPVPEDTEKSEEKSTKAADTLDGSGTSHALSAEVKKYGKMVVPKDAAWIIQDSAYSLGNAVSNTHSCFSEMRLATLRDFGSTNVVAKTNRPGASYEDKMQMTALMNFLATEMPKHDNIVGFYGALPPTAKTAPILFLEYCDEGSLLYWVKETRNVTDEVEDQMINFAIHVATGMDHMHLNGMLHRKLRAENILLKHSFANQMVAKISGMGPENDTVKKDDEGEDSTQRWVAPEQYDKARLFTHKTDIWSYGVLLHEMFNMGKEPYSGMSVTEMKESVKSGFRMGKPRHAPEFMYDGVMKRCWQENQSDRPDFSELTNVMMAYFEGGKGEPDLDPKLIDLMDS